jgi:DNA-binding transcriptional LysR family regulator
MSEVDLHQLRAFVAVSRHGSVAHAAHALRLTASPVSRTIRELERSTGRLFEREYHDMRLTERGHRLLPLAVGVVRQADDLLDVARDKEPPLRWSATPWAPERFAARLRETASAVGAALEVEGAVSAVLLHRMCHGEIDIALVHLPVSRAGLASAPLARYRFRLGVPSDDPLARGEAVTKVDLAGRRILLLPLAMQPEAMASLHSLAHEVGAESVEEMTLADVPLLAGRIRRERAVTFGVTYTGSPVPSGPGITWVPFAENPVDFVLGLVWRDDDPVRRERLAELLTALRPSGELAVID